jgi:hypothetical protein
MIIDESLLTTFKKVTIFEVTGTVGLNLKSNNHYQVKLVQIIKTGLFISVRERHGQMK